MPSDRVNRGRWWKGSPGAASITPPSSVTAKAAFRRLVMGADRQRIEEDFVSLPPQTRAKVVVNAWAVIERSIKSSDSEQYVSFHETIAGIQDVADKRISVHDGYVLPCLRRRE